MIYYGCRYIRGCGNPQLTMNEWRPNRPTPKSEYKQKPLVGASLLGKPPPDAEQPPQGGGGNKPELRPPAERPLPFEPNLPSHEQQVDALDPEVERLVRAYAEAEAEGDPKKAESLFKRYRKDSSLIDFFKNGPTPLAYGPHPPGGFRTSSKEG